MPDRTIIASVYGDAFKPLPRHVEQAIYLSTGKPAETHCLCLDALVDGVIYEVCCECWYTDADDVFIVEARKSRQPKKPKGQHP